MEASRATKRVRVGEVVGETFSIYGQNAAALLASAFLLFLVVGILTAILAGPSREEIGWGDALLLLLALIIRVAATALYTGFVVKVVDDSRSGNRHSTVGELYSAAAPAIPALVVLSILFGVAVAVGLFIFIIPGLILLTIWAVTAPAIVVEGCGPIESFGRSRELVRGQGWSVFWTIVVVWLITAVITFFFGLIGDAISGAMYGVMVSIAAFVTAPIQSLAHTVMFFNLGGGSTPQPAAETAPQPGPAA